MEESKETKETKEVKKTTRKKATTAKKPSEEKIEITLDELQKMIAQMAAMTMANNTPKEENVSEKKLTKKKGRVTKADLHKIRDREVTLKSANDMCSFKSNKTNIMYSWVDENDEETMTVAEILNMEAKSKKFLHTPWLIMIEDYDNGETIKMIVEALGLEKIYENLVDVDELLEKDLCDIEEILNEASDDYKEVVASKIRRKVVDKELRDIILIKELERMLDKTFI